MDIHRVLGVFIAVVLFTSPVVAKGTGGKSGGKNTSRSHAVKGYTKKDGTHVAPHRATNPNKSKSDNYSSKGNVNPNTGKEGTKDPEMSH